MASHDNVSERPAGCLIRLFWMLLGNIALLVCAYLIADRPGDFFTFSALDIVYGTTIVALTVARYVDIRHMSGGTVTGTPASMTIFRRYLVALIAFSVCVWAAAHGVAALRM